MMNTVVPVNTTFVPMQPLQQTSIPIVSTVNMPVSQLMQIQPLQLSPQILPLQLSPQVQVQQPMMEMQAVLTNQPSELNEEPPSYDESVLSPNGERSLTNLFIRKLSSKVSDDELTKLFEPYGKVVSSKVIRDIHNGLSRGTGFVRFETHEEASKAMAALDKTELYDRVISIQWAKKEYDNTPIGEERKRMHKLFVRNVPLDVSKSQLLELFSQYGKVSDVTILDETAPTASQNQPKRNIAFIVFEEDGAAEEASTKQHATFPFSSCESIPLMVKLADDNRLRPDRRKGNLSWNVSGDANSFLNYSMCNNSNVSNSSLNNFSVSASTINLMPNSIKPLSTPSMTWTPAEMGLSVPTNCLSPSHLNTTQDALSLSLYHPTLPTNLNSGIVLSVEPNASGSFIVSEVNMNNNNNNNTNSSNVIGNINSTNLNSNVTSNNSINYTNIINSSSNNNNNCTTSEFNMYNTTSSGTPNLPFSNYLLSSAPTLLTSVNDANDRAMLQQHLQQQQHQQLLQQQHQKEQEKKQLEQHIQQELLRQHQNILLSNVCGNINSANPTVNVTQHENVRNMMVQQIPLNQIQLSTNTTTTTTTPCVSTSTGDTPITSDYLYALLHQQQQQNKQQQQLQEQQQPGQELYDAKPLQFSTSSPVSAVNSTPSTVPVYAMLSEIPNLPESRKTINDKMNNNNNNNGKDNSENVTIDINNYNSEIIDSSKNYNNINNSAALQTLEIPTDVTSCHTPFLLKALGNEQVCVPSSFNLQAEQSGMVNTISNINNKDVNAFTAMHIAASSPVTEGANKCLSLTPIIGNAVHEKLQQLEQQNL